MTKDCPSRGRKRLGLCGLRGLSDSDAGSIDSPRVGMGAAVAAVMAADGAASVGSWNLASKLAFRSGVAR